MTGLIGINGELLGQIPLGGWKNDKAREIIKKELKLRGNKFLWYNKYNAHCKSISVSAKKICEAWTRAAWR